MNIILVRHGESEYNARIAKDDVNPKLTGKGRKQAEAVARALKKYKISEIYTSHLSRAKETAATISRTIKVPVKENLEELSEYPADYLRHRLKSNFRRSLKNREKKLKRFLDKISGEKEENKNIVIVAHGITNKIILGYLTKVRLNKKLLRFSQDNTGINILTWKPKYHNWNVLCLNDIRHLPKILKGEEELR